MKKMMLCAYALLPISLYAWDNEFQKSPTPSYKSIDIITSVVYWEKVTSEVVYKLQKQALITNDDRETLHELRSWGTSLKSKLKHLHSLWGNNENELLKDLKAVIKKHKTIS